MMGSLTFRLWRWTFLFALVWWCAGLNLFIYHIAAFFLFLGMIYLSNRRDEGLALPSSALYTLLIATFYFLSILIHVFFVGAEADRIVASLYNLSFWVMGSMLIIVLSNAYSSTEMQPILKSFNRLAWITGILAIAMLIAWQSGRRVIEFDTPLYGLGKLLGRTQLVENSLVVRPLLWDWFASASRPRFNVFSPYPTAAGGILVIVLIWISTYAAMERKSWHPVFLALLGANLLGLMMTLSRISILGFVFSLMLIFLLQRKNTPIWLLFLFVIAVLLIPLIKELLDYMLALRGESSSIRKELYIYSLQQLDGIDWVLGYGVKPREESFMFPLGSHSTYISMLFKCGLIGFVTLVLFQSSLLWRWYTLKAAASRRRRDFLFWRGLGWTFFSLGCWLVTEDIDAPQFLAFLYFSLIGIFEGFRRRVLNL